MRVIAFLIIAALQIAGPLYFGFTNWCNVIQYVSGFAYTAGLIIAIHFLHHYYTVHKPQLKRIEDELKHMKESHHANTDS